MAQRDNSPIGQTSAEAGAARSARSEDYRSARDEYARIRELRRTNPIAAHLRERRFELGLTQQDVAAAAGTSHTAISRLESGTHTPSLATLQKIAAVLDEELVVCFQRTADGNNEREFARSSEPDPARPSIGPRTPGRARQTSPSRRRDPQPPHSARDSDRVDAAHGSDPLTRPL